MKFRLGITFGCWVLGAEVFVLAACSSSNGSIPSFATFTPRGLPVSSGAPGAPFIPTLTPVPLGRLPGAITTYRIDVTLDYLGHRAQVSQSVEAVNPGPDQWDQLVFQLPVGLRTPSFILNSITVSDGGASANATYQLQGNLLRVLPPRAVPPNAPALITINYGLAAQPVTAGTRPPDGSVGYSDKLIQFINWYPVLVPYRPGSGWLPVGGGLPDIVPADPVFAEVATYELAVTTSSDVTVVSGGPLAHNAGRWTFALNNARTIAFAASPQYQSLEQSESGVTVVSYFLPEYAEAGKAALTTAAQSLSIFIDRFGAYPYRTLVVAENAYFGSAAAGGIVLHTGQGYADYNGRADTLLVATLPQAVARLWWGQVVSGDSFAEPWLNEALPMYAELIFDQSFHPELQAWYWEARVNYWQPAGKLDRAASQFADTEDYLRNLLRRGALFLRDVRALIGDDAFFAFLQDYYRNGAYRTVSADDFFNALRRHAPAAVDLDPLLAEYFSSRAMPTPAPTLTPASSPTALGSPAPTPVVHIVRSGETLTTIAQQYGVAVEAIVRANQLANPDAIFVGQKLIIPSP